MQYIAPNGQIIESVVNGIQLADRYHPDFIATLVSYDPAHPTEPLAPTLVDLKAQLQQAATAIRWEVETGGITLTGMRVATAKADQDRITSVLVNAAAAGVSTVDFKAESGWITLNLNDVRDVASAIALHVQACFSAERAHHEAIEALGSVAEAQAYDVNQGWPA